MTVIHELSEKSDFIAAVKNHLNNNRKGHFGESATIREDEIWPAFRQQTGTVIKP